MNKIVKDTIAITLITLFAGLFLGIVYEITKEPIAHQAELAKAEAYQKVFEDAAEFEQIIAEEDADLQAYLSENGYDMQTVNEVMKAVDGGGQELGYAFTVTSHEGYGGDIQFAMGVKDDGTLNGISILSIAETAGLGMKADTPEFKAQFENKQVEKMEYTKSGATADNQVDAISGATITTSAMVNGVNAGLCAFQYEKGGN